MRQFLTAARTRYRRFRRGINIFVRNRIKLDEDDIRDQMIGGLRRDNEQLAKNLAQAALLLNQVSDRLAYHEKRVPSLKDSKKHYDRALRGVIARQKKEGERAAREGETPT